MTSNREFFTSFYNCNEEKLRLANGNYVKIHGIGEGNIICQDDKGTYTHVTMKDVFFVPNLQENLISIKRLAEKEIQVNFKEEKCNKNLHAGIVISVAELDGSLYRLKSANKVLAITKVYTKDCQHQWHRRLSHRDCEAIKEMSSKGRVQDIHIKDCSIKEVCETRVKDKITKSSFSKKSTHQSRAILYLIHTDVCDPMQTMIPNKKLTNYD